MGYPYYKRFPRDFFEGTIGMSFDVKAAYGLLLDLIFIRDGRLPDDARYIAGHLGLSVRRWNQIRSALIEAGKIKADLGIISTLRSDYLTIERRLSSDYLAEKKPQANENNDLQEPRVGGRARASEPEPEPERIGGDGIGARDAWPDGQAKEWIAALVEASGTVMLDPAREPGLTLTCGRIAAWKRDGADWGRDVIPVVATLAKKARGPIKTWAYFDRAVMQAKADNERTVKTVDGGVNRNDQSRPSPKRDHLNAVARAMEAAGGGAFDERGGDHQPAGAEGRGYPRLATSGGDG